MSHRRVSQMVCRDNVVIQQTDALRRELIYSEHSATIHLLDIFGGVVANETDHAQASV